MKIVIIPTYKDIFGENPPKLSELIAGIPSELIACRVSAMNGELYLNQNDFESQKKILNFLLHRQSIETRTEIDKKISEQYARRGIDRVSIFSTHLNIQFLHLSLKHYHKDENFIGITPEQELRIFKAYFIRSSDIFSDTQIKLETESQIDYFRKNAWPMMIGQFSLNDPYNYFLGIVKSKCFFDALQSKTDFEKYVRAFVGRFNDSNSLNYIFKFVNTLEQTQQRDKAEKIEPISIRADVNSIPFFDELSLNLRRYSSDNKGNYKELKKKPLMKVGQDSYVILNWDFLSRKIYDGMVFDFHKRSGIEKERDFKDFVPFKKFLSEEVIEKYLFKRLINGCFKDKHAIIEFDEDEFPGFPDAYVRIGNKIFLFELKDSLFSADAIDSQDYERIKKEIDKKYNTANPKRKGTYQLANQIQKLEETPFECKSYAQLNLKVRNLVIYPIIIYTDSHFNLPGIGNYLQEEFMKIISKNRSNSKFKNIKDLSFIDIDFLIDKMNQIQEKKFSLDKLIDLSIQELKKRDKRFCRTNSLDDLMMIIDPFESLCSEYLEKHDSDENYLEVLFDVLDLKRGL